MGFFTTPNMSLQEPNILQEPAPVWAADLNTSLSLIDAHDHTTGKGVKITPAGMNINADFTLNGNSLLAAASAQFTPALTLPPVSAWPNRIFVSAVSGRNELFYQDSTGANVQLTSTGAVNQASASIASNGFTGAGYNTSGGGAAAVWISTASAYQFTDNGTTLASTVAASGYLYGAFTIAMSGNLVTPTHGFQQSTDGTSFFLKADNGSGSFTAPVLAWTPNSAGGDLQVNPNPTLFPDNNSAMDIFTSAISPINGVAQRLYATVTAAAEGPMINAYANSSNTNSAAMLQSQVASSWQSSYGSPLNINGRWTVTTTFGSGALLSTPGLDIFSPNGVSYAVGLGGPALPQGVTSYVGIYPSTNGTLTLGDNTNNWGEVWTNVLASSAASTLQILAATSQAVAIQADNGLNIRNTATTAWAQLTAGNTTINGNETVNGNLTVTGSINGSSNIRLLAGGQTYSAGGSAATTGIINVTNSPASATYTPGPPSQWVITLTNKIPTANYVCLVSAGDYTNNTFYWLKGSLGADLQTLTITGAEGSGVSVPGGVAPQIMYAIFG